MYLWDICEGSGWVYVMDGEAVDLLVLFMFVLW